MTILPQAWRKSFPSRIRKTRIDTYAPIIAKIGGRSYGRPLACIELGCASDPSQQGMGALVAPVSRAWERIHITLGRGPKKNWWGWAVGIIHQYPLPLRSAS